jgi:hypothetical protein
MKFHKIESTSKCLKCVDNKAVISRVNRTQHNIPIAADTVMDRHHDCGPNEGMDSTFPSPVGESS